MPIQLYSAPMKYKDQNGDYQSIIGISGNPGRGIASVVLNNDYTLTINFTDNTSTTTSSIRGNGIASIEKTSTVGLVDTYTITDSDGGTSTFTIENGAVPSLSIGTVVEGQAAAATITGTADAPVLNLVLPAANLSNYVQKTDYASTTNAGVVRLVTNGGLIQNTIGNSTYLLIDSATEQNNKNGTLVQKPISPNTLNSAVFYGLARAAGDTSQTSSSNAVGTYTDDAKSAIRTMLGVSSSADVSNKADKADTVLDTTLSRGRKENTTVGTGSFAFGLNLEASGTGSHAEGMLSIASGNYSHAEGRETTANGANSHAEGRNTTASSASSHAEGNYSTASGKYSHAEGSYTISAGQSSHTGGEYNVEDSYDNWPLWRGDTEYAVGDKVKTLVTTSTRDYYYGYICITANNDHTFDPLKWQVNLEKMNYVEIIGNGTANDARSNAYALDWDGNGHYAGDIYINCNSDSTGGEKLVNGLKVVRLI